MNIIEISYENIKTEIDNKNIVKICNNILELLNIDNWEISLVISDDSFIRELNSNYRNKDESTDVISFPQIEGEKIPDGIITAQIDGVMPEDGTDSVSANGRFYAGDIVISLDTVEKNSTYFNVNKNEEFIRLLIHGILHLNGMTHESNEPDQQMLKKQEEILKKITGVDIF
jgi:probable rRNA maturation factor